MYCYYQLNSSMKKIVVKPLCFRKLTHSSGMQNDALMQRFNMGSIIRVNTKHLYNICTTLDQRL